jgi:predicted aldo/keto reductase-like oxidoreductase
MLRKGSESGVTRREFLRGAAVAAAVGAGVAGREIASASSDEDKAAIAASRTLGRTGLEVFPLGAGALKDPPVGRRALDLGINYFDTAEAYEEGKNEITLGKALAGRREEAIVATKWGPWGKETAEDYVAALEASLERLDMEYVDLIQLHAVETAEGVANDAAWEAFQRMRDAGKAKFNGITTHENQVEVVEAVIESGRYDEILLIYSALNGDQMKPAIRKLREAGIGVVAMKGLAPVHESKGTEAFEGLSGNPYQQAIQWVIKDENVANLIVRMSTFDEVAEGLAAARGEIVESEQAAFEEAVQQASLGMCHLCGACTGQCKRGVRVAEVMRYRLYHDGYGERARAAGLYRALPAGASAAACGDCTDCRIVCPWGVPVRQRLLDLHGRLA